MEFILLVYGLSQPNGQTDENTANDTMKTDFVYQENFLGRMLKPIFILIKHLGC